MELFSSKVMPRGPTETSEDLKMAENGGKQSFKSLWNRKIINLA